MKKNKQPRILQILSAVSFLSLLFFSCSKSGNDDSNGGDYGIQQSDFVGAWWGNGHATSSNTEILLTIALDSNGKSEYYAFDTSNWNVISKYADIKWVYDKSTNVLFFYITDTTGYRFTVSNFTGYTMTLTGKLANGDIINYEMKCDSKPSGGSGGSSGGDSTGKQCWLCGGTGTCTHAAYSIDKAYCNGSGDCRTCDGKGWYTAFGLSDRISCPNCRTPGNDERYGDGACAMCSSYRSGKCHLCNGLGYR